MAGGGQPLRAWVQVYDGPMLVKLGVRLKEIDKVYASSLRRRLRAGMREAGAEITAAVKTKAEGEGLHRAAAAVTIKTSLAGRSAGVTVAVPASKAPYARPLDQPNRGEFNRHPVFAKGDRTGWTWVNQPARPFFHTAIEARTPAVEARMKRVLDEVARDAGFIGF